MLRKMVIWKKNQAPALASLRVKFKTKDEWLLSSPPAQSEGPPFPE